jgi:hypothetical protein
MQYTFSQNDYDARINEVLLDQYEHFGESKGPRLARFHVAVSLVLQTEDLSSADIYEQVSDDSNDEGIDFFFTSLDNGIPVVHIFQAKDSKNLPNGEQKAAVLKMIAEVRNLLGKKNSYGLNDRQRTRLQDLKQATKNGVTKYVFYLILTGEQPAKLNREHFSAEDFPENSELFVLDSASLLELLNQGLIPDQPVINFSWAKSDHFLFEKSGTKVIQGYIRAKEFIEQTKEWKDSIFALNPRLFLANKRTGPNDKMMKTLHSDEASYFHILNNGVTAVCKELQAAPGGEHSTLTVSDFQIVNGCQTTSTLWSWANEYPENLNDVYLSLKIIQSSDLAARISETTNSQNSINFIDLESNSDTQKRIKTALESLLRMPYLYVNRAGTWENEKNRRQYQIKEWGVTRGSHFRKIDIRELSQAMIAIAGKPHKAKENLSDIFNAKDTYSTLLEKSWQSGEQLALIADLYLFASNLDFWPKKPSPGASELSALARFYVCYLVYASLKGDGVPEFTEATSDFDFKLIDELRSKEIRSDFVELAGPLAWAALEAVDTVLQSEIHLNKQIEKRGLTRKEEYKKAIENAYRTSLKFIV